MIASLSQKSAANEEVRSHAQRLGSMVQRTPWIYQYFHYQRLVQDIITHSGEDTTKTLFGNYRSANLHAWESLRSQWTKGNAHVAHAALVLFQAVKHEVPCLKVAVERNQKMLQTIHAKSVDLSNHIESESKSYLNLYEKQGLVAPDLPDTLSVSELEIQLFQDLTTVLSVSLPADAERLCATLRASANLVDALDYYKQWTTAMKSGDKIPSISELLEQGHSSLLAPIDTSEPVAAIKTEEAADNDEDTIDWGDYDFDVSSPAAAAIDIVDASVLQKPHLAFRRTLLIELDMVLAFFRMRLNELSIKNDFIDLVMGRSLLSKLPESVRARDSAESVAKFLEGVQHAIESVKEFLRKVDLLESESSRSEVVSTLMQKRSKIKQLHLTLTGMKMKRDEIERALSQAASKAEATKIEMKELKESLEAEISRLCGGRTVTIAVPKIDA